mmetsp:Transcript_27037/g.75535  ORF Transcript_27037/g.75535 Transcript_27037/m.75535 type:complete len:220 (-) Transcript_27037:1131-1790(-)
MRRGRFLSLKPSSFRNSSGDLPSMRFSKSCADMNIAAEPGPRTVSTAGFRATAATSPSSPDDSSKGKGSTSSSLSSGSSASCDASALVSRSWGTMSKSLPRPSLLSPPSESAALSSTLLSAEDGGGVNSSPSVPPFSPPLPVPPSDSTAEPSNSSSELSSISGSPNSSAISASRAASIAASSSSSLSSASLPRAFRRGRFWKYRYANNSSSRTLSSGMS